MLITTISDLHGKHHKVKPPIGGDIIICAGDICPRGTANDVEEFLRWFSDLDYKYKILIAGNHDWDFEKCDNGYYVERCNDYGIIYLNDSGTKVEGLKIWGSPITPEFNNWAFNRQRTQESIGVHWDKIPKDVDILITHGPPGGIMDTVRHPHSPNKGQAVGCNILRYKIDQIKPKMHIFGHIHETRGVKVEETDGGPITFVNTSCLDEFYQSYDEPQFHFEWEKVILGSSSGNDY